MFLALMIGNSRLHWGWFEGKTLYRTWDSDYLALDELPSLISSPPPLLLLASVVPSQTEIWQTYPNVRIITLNEIPIEGLYPTLGIDRALALLGAGRNWGFPMLVIDAGTALTFTGANTNHTLVGGAILPGLGLQIATLAQKTGQLPLIDTVNLESVSLPSRFALNTEEAIQSGVIYTLIAGIKDFIESWWQLYPNSNIAITGGDAKVILNYLRSPFAAPFGASRYPEIAGKLNLEPNLIFWGMGEIIDSYEL